MIAAEIFSMAGSSAVAATLPSLIAEWSLTPAQAGVLSGMYFAGYVCAVPLLVTLTDHLDARLIFAAGALAGAISGFGFAASHSVLVATAFWILGGVSLAGVYMPGLRVIIDRIDPALRVRIVPYYTASFGVGISLSFFLAGTLAQAGGWRVAFIAGGAGNVAALLCVAVATLGTRPNAQAEPARFDLSLVWRNRVALRYIVAYGGHCWELFALRAWLVALLFVAWNRTVGGAPGAALTYWSTAISLAGVPASIIGAECALRFGRPRVVAVVALATVLVAGCLVLAGTRLFILAATGLFIYNVAVLADSAAITTGVVEAASPGAAGATLALHSLIGFLGGALGPMAVGLALTMVGGLSSAGGWATALSVMAAGSVVAAWRMRGLSQS